MSGFVIALSQAHYRELAECKEKADKPRMAERLKRLRVQRQKPAATETVAIFHRGPRDVSF
jgi:hypothetical protein